MIVAWGSCQEHSKFVVEAVRRGAPNTLIGTGINPGAYEAWLQQLGGHIAWVVGWVLSLVVGLLVLLCWLVGFCLLPTRSCVVFGLERVSPRGTLMS